METVPDDNGCFTANASVDSRCVVSYIGVAIVILFVGIGCACLISCSKGEGFVQASGTRKLPQTAKRLPRDRAHAILKALQGKWMLMKDGEQRHVPSRYRADKGKKTFSFVEVGMNDANSWAYEMRAFIGKNAYKGSLEFFEDASGEVLYCDSTGTQVTKFDPCNGVVEFKVSSKLQGIWEGTWRRAPDISVDTARLVSEFFSQDGAYLGTEAARRKNADAAIAKQQKGTSAADEADGYVVLQDPQNIQKFASAQFPSRASSLLQVPSARPSRLPSLPQNSTFLRFPSILEDSPSKGTSEMEQSFDIDRMIEEDAVCLHGHDNGPPSYIFAPGFDASNFSYRFTMGDGTMETSMDDSAYFGDKRLPNNGLPSRQTSVV